MKPCQVKRKMKVPRTSNSMDLVYKIFLGYVRLDGTSYILQMDDTEYGVPMYLKYGGVKTSSSYYKHKTKPLKKAKNMGSDHIAPPSPTEESHERFLKHLTFEEGLMMLELEGGRKVIYEEHRKNMSVNLTQQNGVHSDEQGPVPYNGASESNYTGLLRKVIYEEHRKNMSANLTQQNGVHSDEQGPVPYNGASGSNYTGLLCKVIYEEHRKNMSANLTQQNSVHSDAQGPVPYNGASGSNGEKNGLDLRSFDEKLTAVLREPFDQREYEALMNEAICRKPVMKHRNLRNMSKRYHTHESGQSYLDYYPDLGIQISEANKYEGLNLLHKFFFWLENLCHDGAYRPWVPKTLADKPVFDEEFEN